MEPFMKDNRFGKLSKEMEFLLKRSRELEEKESESRSPVQASGISVVLVDKEFVIQFYDDLSKTLSRAVSSLEMEKGRSIFDFIFGRDAEYCRQRFEMALQGEAVSAERKSEVPGGLDHWFSMFYNPVFSEAGNISGVCLAVTDITKQKQTEEALRKNYEKLEELNKKVMNHDNFLQALLESIPTPVFYKDNQCQFLGCNRAYTKMTGLTSREIEGKTAENIWPKDFSGFYHQKDLELLENALEQRYEYQIKDTSGGIHDIIYCKNVFRNDLNEVAGIVGSFSDITEIKKTAQALKSSEEQFRQLYEEAPIGYQSLDADGKIITVNQIWLDILGYKKEEVLGRIFGEFMTEESRKDFTAGFAIVKEEGSVTGAEFQLKKKDGSTIDISLNGIALVDGSGNFLKTHCVLIDVTKDREILKALREVAGQAKGLKGFIPICAGCKRIQDLEQQRKPWIAPDQYISERLPDIRFSHGMCPDCTRKWYPDYANKGENNLNKIRKADEKPATGR
jgi:PAS domain S-box-containing protein